MDRLEERAKCGVSAEETFTSLSLDVSVTLSIGFTPPDLHFTSQYTLKKNFASYPHHTVVAKVCHNLVTGQPSRLSSGDGKC